MMGCNIFFAEPFRKLMRHSFCQPSRIDEKQRRTMLSDEFHHPVVNFVPHLVGGDRAQSAGRNFDREIKLPPVSNVDDHRVGTAIAGKKVRNLFDWFLCCRQTNAHRRTIGQRFQSFQREREMSAAFVVSHGVDFIHDYSFDIAQDCAASFRCQQNVQGLRGSDQNVRRTLQHRPALVHQCVAGADCGANFGHQKTLLSRHLQNFAERDFKILLDVVP